MFIWRSLSSVRNRALLLAVLPLLSLLTLFTPFFARDASAISPGDLSKKAEVWRGIGGIISRPQGVRKQMSVSDTASCKYVEDRNAEGDTIYGPRLTNENLKVIGLTCTDFFKLIGFTAPSGGQSTFNKPGGFSADSVVSDLAAKGITGPNTFYGGSIRGETPSDGLIYEIAIGMLKSQCTVGFRTELLNPIPSFNEDEQNNQRVQWMRDANKQTPLNTDEADSAENYHFWMWSYENNKVSKNVYHGGDRIDDFFEEGFGIRPITEYQTGPRDSGANYQVDCYQPARLLQDNEKYAKAYAAIIKPGGDVTAGTCADRYTTQQPQQLAACDAGFKNPNDPGFCEATYPATPVELRQACLYGQGPATGGADTVTPPPEDTTNGGDDSTGKTTCKIDGIGWIICPIVTFLSKITDGAYILVKQLLEVEPLSTSTNSDIFNSWQIMRNFANVAFVIFFLVIIFSQLTSVGINNYGIKKLLPKLVVAAILVNISFWICAIAVDISNIIGGSIKGLLESIQTSAGTNDTYWESTSSALLGGVYAGVVLLPVLFFTTLSVLLPMLVVVLATIVTVFLALILRQVLIIILIVISPLAFVAYLLPNTEDFFKKWRTTFQLLLMVYPVIGFVFGASALASTIIMKSSTSPFIQIAGAAAAIIPLVIAPALISGINKVANRFGLPNVGVKFGRLQKGAEGFRDKRKDIASTRRFGRAEGVLGGTGKVLGGEGTRRRRLAAFIRGSGVSGGLNAEQKAANAKKALAEAKQDYIVSRAAGGGPAAEAYAQAIAGPTGDASKIIASAISVQATAQAEEIKAASQRIEQAHLDLPNTRLVAQGAGATQRDAAGNVTGAISAGDERARQAAIQKIVSIGDIGGVRDLVDSAHTMDGETRKVLADSLQTNKPGFMSATAINNLRQGTKQDTTSLVEQAINSGVYSADKLAKADKDEVALVASALASGSAGLDPTAALQAQVDADTALRDPRYSAGKNRGNLENVVNGSPGTPVT